MKQMNKLFAVSMILVTIIFCFPEPSFSGGIILPTGDGKTIHLPESVSTPEKDIPAKTTNVASEKDGRKWLWAVVIIAAIAGVASGAGSGGGSGGSGTGTGSINVNW